ncbi:polymorphic toxin-type HINT domain-containing protein [Glaesserella parasuis]|nr:polymorphic toxin-type HINT domain-containing protein [Glaesserella parasuis]
MQILAVNLPLVLSTSGISLACTEVQITDSEKQKSLTGKTAEETLQSLNRDVANANQKLEKQDLQAIQESQEATQIVAEMGAKAVGDLAKMMNWEEGSPQKIALHGLIGYLSAKVGGGNTAASTLSAMGSEYINSEIANYLQENTALTADQRNAIQQASAAGLGALIGASLGGDSNTVNQSAQMAWRTEKFNRQLHPDEMKWIKAHAKEFAEQEGLTVEEAEKRLSQQAAKELDILWFLKLDSSTDDKAKAFLASQNNATFIDSKGDVQHYFVAKDNDFWTSRKYASDAYDYMQATGDNFYGRNLQTDTTVWEGTKDKLGKAYDHISENKLETAKAVGNAVIDGVVECGSNVTGCLGNFVAELWTKGTSSASEMGKNLVLSDQEKINALYGQNVEKEMVAVSSSQFVATLTEALGVGKIITKAGKEVIGASVKEIKAPVKDVVNSPKELVDEVLETAARETSRTCSFRGDMEVKTEKGYQPISTIKVGDKVLAKNEVIGITTYQKVQAHYSNPYDYTVYVEVKDSQGKYQTIVSNKIHPFFTQVLNGTAPISSEGHNYKGKIAKGQWVDAQHLKQGYRLLSESGEWQTVYKVTIQSEKLQAYNLTVDEDHTYFIKGAKTDSQGVWVHNDCWHALPSDVKQVANIDGYKAYQFKDPKDGKVVTVVQKDLNRFETPSHQNGVDPHFNRLSQQIDAETGRYLSTSNPVDGLYNRSYLRSETLQKIYANYEKLPNGNYRDLDGNIIKGPIDIGHMYGWEHRRLSLAAKELNWSQKQFNDYVNARPERFMLENMSENRSHKNEMPGWDNIEPIIRDMEKFEKGNK